MRPVVWVALAPLSRVILLISRFSSAESDGERLFVESKLFGVLLTHLTITDTFFFFYYMRAKKTIESSYLPTGSTVINTPEANEGWPALSCVYVWFST